MKKWTMACVVACLLAATGSVWAGSACCAVGSKDKAKTEAWDSACASALKGIELTAEQQEKMDAIQAECKAASCSKESCDSALNKMRDVLTEDQKAKFNVAAAAIPAGGGCAK